MTEDMTEDMEKTDFDAMFEGLTDEEALQKLLDLTDQLLKDGYGEGNYEVKAEGNIVYIDIWYDGLKAVLDEVKQDESQKYKWDAVLGSMQEASAAFASLYNKYGMDVSVCVLDDTDHDYVLISTYNDKIYYDDYIGTADETIFE